eukprot:6042430-Pleurochrysis_carterae.AAC.3
MAWRVWCGCRLKMISDELQGQTSMALRSPMDIRAGACLKLAKASRVTCGLPRRSSNRALSRKSKRSSFS